MVKPSIIPKWRTTDNQVRTYRAKYSQDWKMHHLKPVGSSPLWSWKFLDYDFKKCLPPSLWWFLWNRKQDLCSRGMSSAQHGLTWIVGKSMQVRVHWVCPLLTVAADHCCPGMKGPPSGERYQQQHPEEANQYTQALFVSAKGSL